MKTTLFNAIIILFVFTSKTIAQDTTVTSGIFLTAKDFQHNKLIQEVDCENDKAKFKTNKFFSKSSFDVLYKGKSITYKKKNIYAYRNCDNKVWRFYNDKEYQILEISDLYIYSARKIVMDGGIIEEEPLYYFSSTSNGDIKKLTLANLKLTFPTNQVYQNMLDSEFMNDTKIYRYDVIHKMYKVNYLLIQSNK